MNVGNKKSKGRFDLGEACVVKENKRREGFCKEVEENANAIGKPKTLLVEFTPTRSHSHSIQLEYFLGLNWDHSYDGKR